MIQVVMPQMGESLAEGTVVRWLKKPGDRVERDEPMFEISTDKVDTDVPSPAAGVVDSVLVQEGQTVGVGVPVAIIREDGTESPKPTAPATDESAGHFRAAHAPQLVSFRKPTPKAADPTASTARSFSPAVLSAARARNVPLDALTTMRGSGRGGRVTKADVARFVETGASSGPAPPRPAAAAAEVPHEYIYRPTDRDRVVPMSPVRRKIAHHMTWSTRISPHASAFVECDATNLVALVRRGRAQFAERVGAPLTYTVAAADALVQTLRDFPALNASVVDDAIVLKPAIHLGIAVALADSDELVVPVIRDADGLTIEGLARTMNDLVARARERRLRLEDVQGGTFTLTNPGMFGGLTGTPILNQPQVGIVGLGAIAKRAVVLDGDRIAARDMLTIALTFDHRAIDGMAAFRFLDRLRQRIEKIQM